MSDKDIDQILDELQKHSPPAADPAAREQALQAASAEFRQQFPQGNENTARPIDKRSNPLSKFIKSIGSMFMNTNNSTMAYQAFGTAAIAFVAASVFFNLPDMSDQSGIDDTVYTVTEPMRPKIKAVAPGLSREPTPGQESVEEGNEPFVTAERPILAERPLSEHRSLSSESIRVPAERETVTDAADRATNQISTAPRQDLKNLQQVKPQSASTPAVTPESAILADEEVNRAAKAESRSEPLLAVQKTVAAENYNATGVVLSQDADISIAPPRLDNSEEYAQYTANPIKQVAEEPVSTFSIDVDTASYSLIRNQLGNGYLPNPQAVRAEELINYFDYDYPAPRSKKQPFEPSVSVLESPWNEGKKLLHIGIRGYDIPSGQTPDSNLVFLLDVSGSMSASNKLPLVKQSVALLLETLKPEDTVSIVVYAGAAGTVLEPTKVKNKGAILAALQRLNAGGSTAGGAGIRLAYQLAEQNFNSEAVNRIILATDGDFNVGQQRNEELQTLVERKRDSGVFLSVLGFGRNNYQDDMMQTLAQNGNGVAAYIDTLSEARKVLVDEATSTLFPIAKDVKIQVEFNPATVSDYRLIGYETRHLNREDFNNDKVDAGDIGAGHTVTAIYEITSADAEIKSMDAPRYEANNPAAPQLSRSDEYGFLKIRYKLPNEKKSKLIEMAISSKSRDASSEAEFSAAVAGFAQLLTGSKHTGKLTYDDLIKTATRTRGADPFGYRSEFIQLLRMAKIAQP